MLLDIFSHHFHSSRKAVPFSLDITFIFFLAKRQGYSLQIVAKNFEGLFRSILSQKARLWPLNSRNKV